MDEALEKWNDLFRYGTLERPPRLRFRSLKSEAPFIAYPEDVHSNPHRGECPAADGAAGQEHDHEPIAKGDLAHLSILSDALLYEPQPERSQLGGRHPRFGSRPAFAPQPSGHMRQVS